MHTVFALLCFVVVIHWLIFPYPSGLLHWHCGNLTIAPVPAKQPWWIWINTSCEFIMNDCITTTKQSTTKPCAYFLGYTVSRAATSDNSVSVVCNYFVRELDKSSFVAHGIRATLNERLCISFHWPLDCLFWSLFGLTAQKKITALSLMIMWSCQDIVMIDITNALNDSDSSET